MLSDGQGLFLNLTAWEWLQSSCCRSCVFVSSDFCEDIILSVFFFFLLQKRKSKRRSKKGTFQWTDSWHQGGRRRCGPHFCGVICVCVGGRDQKKKTKRGMGWGGWGILGVGSGVTGGARLLGQQIKDEASGIFWPWSWCSGQSRPSKMDLT